ncbi:MAG: hypothetical protein ACO1N9_10270 [Flavobacterium sp.]
MKRIIFSVLSIITTLTMVAQDYPGDMPELLLNRQLKVLPESADLQKYGYREFYTTPEMQVKDLYKKTDKYSSPYDELVGKTFTVENIESIGTEKFPAYRLKLKNNEGLPVLYYKYNPKSDADYRFEVIGELKYPDGFFCKYIEAQEGLHGPSKVTPVYEGITITKETVKGKPEIFFMMNVPRDNAMVTKNGVTLELQNGKIIKKPLGVVGTEINKYTGGFLYTFGTGLSLEDLKLLSQSPIVKVKTSIFDEPVNKGSRIMEYAKCLLQ